MKTALAILSFAFALAGQPAGNAGPGRDAYRLEPEDVSALAQAGEAMRKAVEFQRETHARILARYGDLSEQSILRDAAACTEITRACTIEGDYIVCIRAPRDTCASQKGNPDETK